MAKLRRRHLGTHLVVEFHGCRKFGSARDLEKTLRRAAALCHVHVISATFHRFPYGGITGILLLAESHISIHTWPEFHYAAVDIFTCGIIHPKQALLFLKKELGAKTMSVRELKRGGVKPERH